MLICGWYLNHNKELILSRVSNFIKSKCDHNLHKIGIKGDMELVPLAKEIKKFLYNVEVVEFIARNGHDEALFLRYCPNVAKLSIGPHIVAKNVEPIVQQKYHRLTHFYYDIDNAKYLNAIKWESFFQKNDKIECVVLQRSDIMYNDDLCDHAVLRIKALDYALNLQILFLSIGQRLTERFDVICNYLNVLCARQNFKSLEIEFSGSEGYYALNSHANQLANLKQFTKIHLRSIELTAVMSALRSLIHLKTVVMYDVGGGRVYSLDELIDVVDGTHNMELAGVEEVLIEGIGHALLTRLTQLVRHWINLKRIMVPVNVWWRHSGLKQTNFETSYLNRIRGKLKNASALTIYTNHKVNATNLQHELVKLKLVKFVHYESDCNGSPLQPYRMISRQ